MARVTMSVESGKKKAFDTASIEQLFVRGAYYSDFGPVLTGETKWGYLNSPHEIKQGSMQMARRVTKWRKHYSGVQDPIWVEHNADAVEIYSVSFKKNPYSGQEITRSGNPIKVPTRREHIWNRRIKTVRRNGIAIRIER